MKKAGMILEGGGQRGIFTSGVLDYLMEKKVQVPYVLGVSAGACNAVEMCIRDRGKRRKDREEDRLFR